MLLKSLADTVGCYLRAQVIPIAKISFYSGSMTYEYSERIFDLYEEMKRFLHTDGHGWDSPISINRFNVTTFVNNTYSDNRINTSNCDNLITYQGENWWFQFRKSFIGFWMFLEGAEKRKRSYDARRRRNPVRRYRHIKSKISQLGPRIWFKDLHIVIFSSWIFDILSFNATMLTEKRSLQIELNINLFNFEGLLFCKTMEML